MKDNLTKAMLATAICLLNFAASEAQTMTVFSNLKFIACRYESTLNKSFSNKKFIFIQGSDSVIFNMKVPFNPKLNEIEESGIYYNCSLKKDSIYSFKLKSITKEDIPKEYNSYYFTNALFISEESSRFNEYRRNTAYTYRGIYGLFIDMNNRLYKIESLFPAYNCAFQH